MPTRSEFFSVGTTPVKVLDYNALRVGWRVTMLSSGIAAANTGRIHLGRNFVPNATVGDPNSGDVLVQGSEMSEEKAYPDDEVFIGELWAIGSAAAQQIQVEQTIK